MKYRRFSVVGTLISVTSCIAAVIILIAVLTDASIGNNLKVAIVISSGVIAVLSVCMIVLTAGIFRRSGSSLVSQLREAAEKIAGGDFSYRLSVPDGDDDAEIAQEFNKMSDSLQSLEKMRDSFVSAVSHDLKSPMTTISGFIDCILSGAITPDNQEKYLLLIKSEVMRLSRLVTQMLDISRIQAGDRIFLPAVFDLRDLAANVLFSLEREINEKKLEVGFSSERDRMAVFADKDSVYQIVYNLMDNAVKFSRVGGALKIDLSEDGERIYLSVFNEGQGIADKDKPYVFDRFYKADVSRGLDRNGYGLGLYISKKIADSIDATLTLDSVENEYCRFVLGLKHGETYKPSSE